MTDIELKLCPFCGAETFIDYYSPGKGFGSFTVECLGCGSISGSYTHMNQAIESWNKRVEVKE